MQSSLLGLALANKFFVDPLVGLPAAISVSSYFVIYTSVCVYICICDADCSYVTHGFWACALLDYGEKDVFKS